MPVTKVKVNGEWVPAMPVGEGDMTKAVYDTNDNGIVDKATADANGNVITTTYATKSEIPTNLSDLVNDSGYITGMTILSYGSSTWNDFITAYNANRVVYCRASSGADPSQGSQTRLAFMAYVNNATTPTEVEFQYYRSVSSHSASQQGDQVFVYKITSSGTWTVTTREADSKIAVTSPVSSSYSSETITLSLADAYGDTKNPYGTKTANYVLAGPTSGSAAAPSFRALVANDIPSLTVSKISDISLSNGTITIGNNSILIPTKTSNLTNDSGFITLNDIPDANGVNF